MAGPAAAATADIETFLARHWSDPIPPQGTPPAHFTPAEADLAPAACALCHADQHRDWQGSLHARAMGPGVAGQLLDLVVDDPATAAVCWRCHTPLAEQRPLRPGAGGWQENPAFRRDLLDAGLICAGCHVRQHRRYGPPRRAEPERTGPIRDGLPHDGFTATRAFASAAFCRGCHQFDADGYALNGKLLENTYAEWAASGYPERGITCQSCHMPDRRHLWRGIHDPETTRSGVTLAVELTGRAARAGDPVEARIALTNSGTGHHFPTYLTPKVFVRAWVSDAAGNAFDATFQEAVVGREATLDLAEELYDTRIPAGRTLAIPYRDVLPDGGMRLEVEVAVAPDHFYTRFYEATLANGGGGRGRTLLQRALEESQASPYVLFRRTLVLAP